MKFGGFAILSSLGLTTVLCGALIAVTVIDRPAPDALIPRPTPVYFEALIEATDQNQPATIETTFLPDVPVVGSGINGIVTEVRLNKGDAVADGTHVMSVDGVDIFSYVSEIPFYRELRIGSEGPDVLELQRFLVAHAGAKFTPNGKFGPSTQSSVRKWEQKIGVKQSGIASPTWFVRLNEPLVIKSTEIELGTPAPTLGSTLFTGEPHLESIKIESTFPVEPGDFIFQSEIGHLEVSFDGTDWEIADPAMLLGGLTATPVGEGKPTPTSKVEGRLSLAEDLEAVSVPASSVVGSTTGATLCVWVRSSEGSRIVSGLSFLANSGSGAVLLDDLTLAGREILATPILSLEDPLCP